MLLNLICLAVLQTPSAADFFPTVPGTVRTYSEGGRGSGTLVSTVGAPLDMGGASVIPVTETPAPNGGRTTYFRVEPSEVTIIAYDLKKPLPVPMPVLQVGSGKVVWDFEGKTATGPAGEELRAHGVAHFGGQRVILGKKVDVLIVTLSAALGTGASGVTFDETTVYAKGIGMVELTRKSRLGRNKKVAEVSYQITNFEPGKEPVGETGKASGK